MAPATFQQIMNSLVLHPLNQIAALKLKTAGVAVDPDSLPVFQLMAWGLEGGVPLTHRLVSLVVSEFLRFDRPDQSFEYLIANVPGGLPQFQTRLLRLKPRAAAEALIELMDMRLKADPETSYPASWP